MTPLAILVLSRGALWLHLEHLLKAGRSQTNNVLWNAATSVSLVVIYCPKVNARFANTINCELVFSADWPLPSGSHDLVFQGLLSLPQELHLICFSALLSAPPPPALPTSSKLTNPCDVASSINGLLWHRTYNTKEGGKKSLKICKPGWLSLDGCNMGVGFRGTTHLS